MRKSNPAIVKKVMRVKITSDARNTFRFYGSNIFHGACLDTGAQRAVIGLRQAKASSKRTGCRIKKHPTGVRYRFGDGKLDGIGSIPIGIPISGGRFVPHIIDVGHADIPLLIGLDFMKKEKLKLDVVDDLLEHKHEGWSILMTYKFGHIFIEWPAQMILFTRKELEKLHLSFFHPSVQKLYELIRTLVNNFPVLGPNADCLVHVAVQGPQYDCSATVCGPQRAVRYSYETNVS